MQKYLTIFTISFANQSVYRLNFIMGRVGNIIVLLLLYYLWTTVTRATGSFAGFSTQELLTYIAGIHIARAVVFGGQSRKIAQEINDGSFSNYLTKPVNHFFFWYVRELSDRMVLGIMAAGELVVFSLLLNAAILAPFDAFRIFLFLLSLFLAHVLYYILSYLMSILAFWSRETMGPRFLFEWFLEFASGAYFPLSILPSFFLVVLHALPFVYLLYLPLMVYLGKLSVEQNAGILVAQLLWIGVAGMLTATVWKKGLRRYAGEGM